MWEANDGEVGSVILLFLLFGGCFDCRCVMVVGLGQKGSFLFLFLVLLKEMRIRVSPTPSLVFTISGTFTEVMEGTFKVNANEDVEDMNLRDFFQDTSTTPPATPQNHRLHPPYTLPKVYSSTPPSSKQKQSPKEESNPKTITPRSTDPTSTSLQRITTAPFTATLKHKGPVPNHKILKLTRRSSPSPLISLSLTPPTPPTLQRPSQTHMPLFNFPTIFSKTFVELLGIIIIIIIIIMIIIIIIIIVIIIIITIIIIIIYIIIVLLLIIIITIIINLFSVDQINRIHNHSIYVKVIAITEDKW